MRVFIFDHFANKIVENQTIICCRWFFGRNVFWCDSCLKKVKNITNKYNNLDTEEGNIFEKLWFDKLFGRNKL